MSLTWTITLEGELPIKADDIQFVFKDISRLNPRVLRPAFFQDLFNRIDEYDYYVGVENVKNVINNEGESLPFQLCSVLFSTKKETQQQEGVAFLQLDDGNFLPIAVWPTEFAELIITDLRILHEYIKNVIQQPEKYNDVRFIIPIKFGEEYGKVPKQILWSVIFEGETPGSEDDWGLEFIDLKQYQKEPKILIRNYFQELIRILDTNSHYRVIRQIKQVKSNMNETLPIDDCIVINAFGKEEEIYFNFLLHSISYEEKEIIGIWPPTVAEAFLKNKDLLNNLILRLIQTPEFFSEVHIFIPIKIEEQIAKQALRNVWTSKYKPDLEIASKDQIKFIDCFELMGHISPLKPFFTQLMANINKHKNYLLYNEILEFRIQSGETLNSKEFAFVYVIKKDGSTQGLLFKKDKWRYTLHGVYPESFLALYAVDDKILFEFIDTLVKTPEDFKEVKIYIPP
ncbi:MAG: hypothetical protein ACFFD2_07590 [Promethearchaeota archaeon]